MSNATTDRKSGQPLSSVGFEAPWLREFLYRGTGLSLDGVQTARVAGMAERKLVDLFDAAEQTALANGRVRVLLHDLPLTKGLRAQMAETQALAGDIALRPLLVFLGGAGLSVNLDDAVRVELPRLMATLLLLTGRVIAILEPANMTPQERLDWLLRASPTEPTRWELDRALRVLNMTL